MSGDTALAVCAGAAVSAVAALAGFLWLRRVLARGSLAPQALLQATALRLALTLAGALALALGWREQATAALAGLAGTYLVLLVVETSWIRGRATSPAERREEEG